MLATEKPMPVIDVKHPRCLKGEPDDGTSGLTVAERKPQPDPVAGQDRRALLCKACRARITRRVLAMEVNGSHRHVFFNPHGLVFELGCFASAKNVIPTGPKTDEFTWFPGHAWQVVACAGCSTQLGWRYTGPSGGFFGLILAALIEEDRGPS
jgi:hypothetical protein